MACRETLILPEVVEAYKVHARAAVVSSPQRSFAFQQSIQTSCIKEIGRDIA